MVEPKHYDWVYIKMKIWVDDSIIQPSISFNLFPWKFCAKKNWVNIVKSPLFFACMSQNEFCWCEVCCNGKVCFMVYCLSMKSPSQSEPCKCIIYVTAGKVRTWLEFLWRWQLTACVRHHLLLLDSTRGTCSCIQIGECVALVLDIHLLRIHEKW